MDPVHYRFGDFLLQPDRRCLAAAGVPVNLSARAFDLLTLLVERHDRVVTKDEILASVWAGSIVEENNLAVQVSALRRVLGTEPDGGHYIMTVPGRGYRFVAPLLDEPVPAAAEPDSVAPPVVVLSPEPASAAPRRRWASWRWLAAPALVALVLTGVAARLLPHGAPRSPPHLSIVVLPFRNLDGDPRHDYLADAISDDISIDLSQLPGSVVIARESAEALKDRTTMELRRSLAVRYVLDGSLLQEGASWQVNARLIDAEDGRLLWAQRFDVAQDALSAARNDIVNQLGQTLKFTLVQMEAARSLHDQPDNQDAVGDYLRARHILDVDQNPKSLMDAQVLLEAAVQEAPGYTDAQALLAVVLLDKSGSYNDRDEIKDRKAAKFLITAALKVAPRDPTVIIAQGMLAWINQDCIAANGYFNEALLLDRSNIIALLHQAACMRSLGQMSASLTVLRKGIRMDPYSARNKIRHGLIGLCELMLGLPHDALRELESVEETPTEPVDATFTLSSMEWNHLYLIAATWLDGQTQAAADRYAVYARLWPHRTVWQLASYDTTAMAHLKPFSEYLAALHAAGMPLYADENADMHVSPSSTLLSLGDFDPTPLVIPGARRVTASQVAAALGANPPPRVLDVGSASAVIPGGVVVCPVQKCDDYLLKIIQVAAQGRDPQAPIIIMGDGPFGEQSYNAVLILAGLNYRHLLWYRGGEQSWVAAGYPTHDARPQ